jgi:hypothetical protein
MSATAPAVPYEKQFDMQASRTCGAACLSMVYRSLGQEVSQRLIWPLIAKKNIYGSIASTTHLMVADALTRGFSAVAIQVRHPLAALRICRDAGIRAILNHRLQPDSPAGHYTVFVDIDETNVKLHDPYFGPSRRVAHDVFLDLWQPRLPNSEIVGNFLIGIAAAESRDVPPCETCHTPFLKVLQCPRCKNAVSLEPVALLGCMNNSCAARLWNYVCCPSCDLTWNFTVEAPQAPAAVVSPAPLGAASPAAPVGPPSSAFSALHVPAVSSSPEDPLNLAQLFQQVDKFCDHILSIPAAANHAEIKKQLDFLKSTREQLALDQAEALANRKLHKDRLDTMAREANQKQEAHNKKIQELNKPSAPLDGDALARALLKNVGFLS